MSGVPISADKPNPPESIAAALHRADWPAAVWHWERLLIAGLEALAGSNRSGACTCFTEAQRLADGSFPEVDLRRITAAANVAIMDDDLAELSDLSARWQAGIAWTASLRPHARARSSTFHLRLERKHPGGYDLLHEQRVRRLWSEGAARLRPLAEPELGAASALDRWLFASRRIGFVDQRKLHAAAALLIG